MINPIFSSLPADFRPMLSGKIKEESDFKRLIRLRTNPPKSYIASPKLDGIRTLLHPDPKKGACTRTLKPIRNTKLFKELGSLCNFYPELLGLDGELTAGPPTTVCSPSIFNLTARAIMSTGGDPANTTEYTFWVFDKFYSHNTDNFHLLPYTARFAHLETLLKGGQQRLIGTMSADSCQLSCHNIHFMLLESVSIDSLEQLTAQEQSYVDKGYEGLMLRDPTKPYKFGRSAITESQQHLIKMKRYEDAEATIIGFEELMHNDNTDEKDNFGLAKRSSSKDGLRPANTLGTLIVKATTGDFEGVTFGIGTGFDQEMRRRIWEHRDDYKGKTVTFEYQAIGSLDAPRFPVFKGFRHD